MIRNSIFLLLLLLLSCAQKNPLEIVLSSKNDKIKRVIDSLEKYEVQILFTEVLEKNGKISFKDYTFQVDDSTYFYPASSVKFPVALLALEKLNQNKLIDRNTVFNVEGDSLKTTFANEIKKIFAVSDNLAYSRLFEYLGQDYITEQLQKRGIISRISHRFSDSNPYNLETKALHFYKNERIIFSSETTKNNAIEPLNLKKVIKGVGFIAGDSLIHEPMDFSLKNYISITSLHNLMKQLQFPELFPQDKRFNISKDDSAFFLNMMKILPREATYNTEEYYDSYGKFYVFGDGKEQIPSFIKIYNKVGYAYGYLTDCSYIVNEKTNKKYIITATIHVNNNQIFNDGVYEYDEVGIPFLAELGRQLISY
jgi:hypothetical protein